MSLTYPHSSLFHTPSPLFMAASLNLLEFSLQSISAVNHPPAHEAVSGPTQTDVFVARAASGAAKVNLHRSSPH